MAKITKKENQEFKRALKNFKNESDNKYKIEDLFNLKKSMRF